MVAGELSVGRSLPPKEREVLVSSQKHRGEEIDMLRKKHHAIAQTLIESQVELDETRKIHDKRERRLCTAAETLRREIGEVKEVITRLEAKTLTGFHATVSEVAAENITNDSEHQILNDQLCKVMKELESTSTELLSIKEKCENVVSLVEEQLTAITETNSRETDTKFMNCIDLLGNVVRDLLEKENCSGDLCEKETAELRDAADETSIANVLDLTKDGEENAGLASGATVPGLRHKLDSAVRDKPSIAESLRKELRHKDDTIALLQGVNDANEKVIEQLRADLEASRGNKNDLCGAQRFNFTSHSSDQDLNDGSSEAFFSIMDTIAAMTQQFEDEIMTSLKRKRQVLATLQEESSDPFLLMKTVYEVEDDLTQSTFSSDESAAFTAGTNKEKPNVYRRELQRSRSILGA